ncbi:facilitated trehalose transporter Tret1-like [Nesidiocoris tenuis]|uniref:Facilitated trehalose transporter Tret1-like n=1 Tax=Nesidiocoris tenuis TaxID=355587 RepID=A0ABN7BG91_9HEMI|nr:facilitated trehalose transporter Tret1-like [Nesidiocoris tenuis]
MLQNLVSFGPYGQWVASIMAATCSLISGQLFSWPSAALPKIYSHSAGFDLSESEAAWMITITFAGNIVSSLPSGLLMDKIGRRNTLILSLLVAMVAWLMLAFIPDVTALMIARFLCGIFGGVVYTVVPAFIGEIVDPKIRGSIVALFGAMMYLGALFESIASYSSYQGVCLISLIPCVVLFFGFLFLPESPYYYLKKSRREDAKKSIIWLKGVCNESDLDQVQAKVEEQLQMKSRFSDLVREKGARRAFIIVEVLQASQRLSGVTFLFAYTTVVVPDSSWVSAQNSFLVLAIVWFVSSMASSSIMDRFNRRTLMAWSCLGSGLAMCAVSVWYYLRDLSTVDTTTTTWFPLFCLIISGVFYSMGIVSIPTLVQGELFAVNVKSKGSAIACITANIFSAIGTRFFYDINNNIGVYFNFTVMGVVPLLDIIFIYLYMIETKGKSLETIQDELHGKNTVEPAYKRSIPNLAGGSPEKSVTHP